MPELKKLTIEELDKISGGVGYNIFLYDEKILYPKFQQPKQYLRPNGRVVMDERKRP